MNEVRGPTQDFRWSTSRSGEAPAALANRATNRPSVERSPRALIWDGNNTSSVLVADDLFRQQWTTDVILSPRSPWRDEPVFTGARIWAMPGRDDSVIEQVLREHPLDALFLHGDEQVRWLLSRWDRLPDSVHRHLPSRESLEIALSKAKTLELAAELDVPVLPTIRCSSPTEVEQTARDLAQDVEVVAKGEGGSAGSTVRALRPGQRVSAELWALLTRRSPMVLVQPRLRGTRLFCTVVYDRGIERAACGHQKLLTWPYSFGVTALGSTLEVNEVHEYTRRMFQRLEWHGLANIEFRQSLKDGRWYFMEINPRANCSLGIQRAAGVDIIGAWTAVCTGRGSELPPPGPYRSGARYYWSVPLFALALRRPWKVPWMDLFRGRIASDWTRLRGTSRLRLLRIVLWAARKG